MPPDGIIIIIERVLRIKWTGTVLDSNRHSPGGVKVDGWLLGWREKYLVKI